MTSKYSILFYSFILITLSLGRAYSFPFYETWDQLPKQLKNSYKAESFHAPWTNSLNLGQNNGFLIIGIGGRSLYEIIEITFSGKCTFIFLRYDYTKQNQIPQWKKLEFTISKERLNKLTKDLEQAN